MSSLALLPPSFWKPISPRVVHSTPKSKVHAKNQKVHQLLSFTSSSNVCIQIVLISLCCLAGSGACCWCAQESSRGNRLRTDSENHVGRSLSSQRCITARGKRLSYIQRDMLEDFYSSPRLSPAHSQRSWRYPRVGIVCASKKRQNSIPSLDFTFFM